MTTASEAADDARTARIRRAIDRARRELIDTSTRSRLLHTPLESDRAKIIEIVDESSDQVFDLLFRQRRAMSFRAAKSRRGTVQEALPIESEVAWIADQSDSVLQTKLESDRLQTRLRGIDTDARTFESEQGVNVLYLAIGFLEWREPREEERVRYAPLILLPVSLERETARSQFKIRHSGEELGTNLSLQERLRAEGVVLPDIDEEDDLTPSAYARRVEERIHHQPGWAVHQDRIVLGLFSFGRLMMYRDLDVDLWPTGKAPVDSEILVSLFEKGFGGDSDPVVGAEDPVDSVIDIAAAGHVVDADSSQSVVIHETQQGRHLVVQGPPGTGKSQTITNIIAAAVRQNKKVLFVAEKMAALNVVKSNLERVGLGGMCLELHSHKARKREVLASLRETFEEGIRGRLVDEKLVHELRASRDELNDYVTTIHEPLIPSCLSPFGVFGGLAKLAGKGVLPPDFSLLAAESWEPPSVEDRRKAVRRAASHIERIGLPAQHTWRGVGLDAVLPQDAQRFSSRAASLETDLRAAVDEGATVGERAGAPFENWRDAERLFRLGDLLGRAPDLDAASIGSSAWQNQRSTVVDVIAAGETFAKIRKELLQVFQDEAWKTDVRAARGTLAQHGRSWVRWFRREYREAVGLLTRLARTIPPTALPERLRLLDLLTEGQRAAAKVRRGATLGREAFGTLWKDLSSDWALLKAIEAWESAIRAADVPEGWRSRALRLAPLREYAALVRGVESKAQSAWSSLGRLLADLKLDLSEAFGVTSASTLSFGQLHARLEAWSQSADLLDDWIEWAAIRARILELDLGDLADRLADGRVPWAAASDVFENAYLDRLARLIFESNPRLARFNGKAHEDVIAGFRDLDTRRIQAARQEVLAAHTAAMPRGNAGVGEIGHLSHQWHLKSRHWALRRLVATAGRAMQALKPVWMMSPMSLAQYVPQGSLGFDLVVMDEASQITPVDALGAIMRAKQLVVVGDEKQLPPTSFFDRMADSDGGRDDEETDESKVNTQVGDIESVLGMCSSRGMPSRMLRWHYRSKHESLIAISNLEFYKQLYIVPSATADDVGLRFRPVKGTYDRGRSRTNATEARAVAQAVMAHAKQYGRHGPYPHGMSLGVAAFSVAQRDCILDELESLRRATPELEPFFDDSDPEPFFVKNLESIQGDERDVIFISVGYGPDDEGYRTMFFGPVSQSGGERRLNVLISRARRRCEVFSSIRSEEIDLERTQATGARVLKTFLEYAETGKLDRSVIGVQPQGSDFEDDVAQALAAAGYKVVQQVGVNGFFVDLAIINPENPGSYLLGIECDGASYHSSRSARDRDRIREMTLRDRGWRIHRIWSTDWFRARDRELRRTIAAINAARVAAPAPLVAASMSAVEPLEPNQPAPPPRRNPLYKEANFSVDSSDEPHEIPIQRRAEIIKRIVLVEGPIHQSEVARRFASVCGKNRTGGRIESAAMEAIRHAVRERYLRLDGEFVYGLDQEKVGPRDRSDVSSPGLRRPECLPPSEIKNGLIQVVQDHLGVTRDEAAAAVAEMFGFQRVTENISAAIEVQLRVLLGDGLLRIDGKRIYPKGTTE